jgi:hypothetical protein
MTTTETLTAEAALKPADAAWACRFCGGLSGLTVLDAGSQPASDLFPAPSDPEPDPEHPLVMVMCADCHLVQLESDPTTPEEPRGVEPAALIAQAEAAVEQAASAGYIRAGTRVYEYPSPHGGSWVEQLARRDMVEVTEGKAELLVDIFGMMHDTDQRAALEERISHMTDDAVLLMQYHTVAAIVRSGIWNALRHGHFAYYSTPVLVEMGRQLGLTAIGVWEYSLYGGTLLLAFAKDGSHWGGQGENVTAMIEREVDEGILDRAYVATLGQALSSSVSAIEAYLAETTEQGISVGGYGAASRTSALLRCAHITKNQVIAVADASTGKHGRTMPGNRIPIVSPADLVELRPERVLLFVPDLLPEVRKALPDIERNGGRWVVLDPMPREVEPVA